ncbi:MAG: polysaccharide deacetylase family protein [Rickettsiales bacterium]
MSLPDDYIRYPRRKYGIDNDRYDWSILPRRDPVAWPGGAKIALWVVPVLEYFPLDSPREPFIPPGGMTTPYPDIRAYSLRDYGSRVGAFRVFKALDAQGIKATVAFNARVAQRYPFLMREVTRRGWEVMAHGVDMGKLHHGELEIETERGLVRESVSVLRALSGQDVRGWASPARSESLNTLDLIAAEGIEYVADWVNDDMSYPMKTAAGEIHSMPHTHEISDQHLILHMSHTEKEFTEQVCDQFDTLYREAATQGGRIMTLTIHPWCSGQPHRIKALEAALAHIMGHDGVWSATGAEILDAFRGNGDGDEG